jgi:hypothetical protein
MLYWLSEREPPLNLIDDAISVELKKEFEGLTGDVRLAVFSQTLADPGSERTRRLVEELGALSPRLKVESNNFVLDKERVEALRIPRIPSVAVLGAEKDYGIRMFGSLGGYEFGTLIDAIALVSKGESGLGETTREALKGLGKSTTIQVFSTPT